MWPSNLWNALVMLEFNISKVDYCSGKRLGEDVPGGGYFRNFWVGTCRWDPILA